MSYDTTTVYSSIPVAMPPKELQEKIDEMLAPEIDSLVNCWEAYCDDDYEGVSAFSASLLDGPLSFLRDEEPDEDTPRCIKERLADYYKIDLGEKPNTSLIKLWAWSESDYVSYTETVDYLEDFFLQLLDGEYFIGGFTHENSKRGGDGGSYVVSKEGDVIRMSDLADRYFSQTKDVDRKSL